MIPADHQHVWQPYATRDVGDGRQQIDSRCQCSSATPYDAGTIVEQRVIVNAEGRVVKLQYRFAGVWFDPTDLLRIRPSTAEGPIGFCPTCGAKPPTVEGLPPCATCNGLGVTVDGQPVAAPALSVA